MFHVLVSAVLSWAALGCSYGPAAASDTRPQDLRTGISVADGAPGRGVPCVEPDAQRRSAPRPPSDRRPEARDAAGGAPRVASELISEASGLVASRQNPGVLWVHNDSGDTARVFALDAQGKLLGVCNIVGARARDWEDIAAGPGPDPNRHYLYLGDIGDNRDVHPEVVVYRVPEPRVAAVPFGTIAAGPPDALRLTYPDGPRDAETLLVDPLTRDIYIISKRAMLSKVYHAPYPQSTTRPTEMQAVALLPWGFAVGGDVSPEGRRVIVRSPLNASLWDRPLGEGNSDPVPLWRAFSGQQVQLPLADEPQGEAICFDSTGAGYFTIGEMAHPPLHYFRLAGPDAPGE